jgi:alkanesulfonate monooxygenase SsuD/methylene tetrahydromethanopterin reductase-like flavin-dependent oxidoreductase (luciferase family)
LPVDLRFIVRLPQHWCVADREGIDRIADAAERLEYWGVSVSDHFLQHAEVSQCREGHRGEGDDRDSLEALQVLAHVGARTRSIRLVTMVILLPIRNVLWLAKQIATQDVLSGGRVALGLGVGGPPKSTPQDQDLSGHVALVRKEYGLFGSAKSRGGYQDEAIQVLDALWRQDRSSFHGKYFSFEDLEVFPKPVQAPRVPIWIGGASERAQERAARFGDGWFPAQVSPAAFESAIPVIRRIAHQWNRTPPADFGANIFVSVAPTDDAAKAMMLNVLGPRFSRRPETVFETSLVGSPASVVQQIARYRAAGVNLMDLKFLPIDPESTVKMMELFRREVWPAL